MNSLNRFLSEMHEGHITHMPEHGIHTSSTCKLEVGVYLLKLCGEKGVLYVLLIANG